MHYILNIYIILIVLSLASCEDKFINDLDIDVPDQEQLLVINLELQANSTIAETFVARSSNINEVDPALYDDAIVELYKDDNFLSEFVFDFDSRNYIASFDSTTLTEGTYRVEVSGIENLNDISATQVIPGMVEILRGEFEEQGTMNDKVKIRFNDPAGQENYYLVQLFSVLEDSLGIETRRKSLALTSVTPVAEVLELTDGVILKDDAFEGTTLEVSLGIGRNYTYDGGTIGNNYIEAVLGHIGRDHYLYLKSLDLFEAAVENPFTEPVIVHNNIENGIGIFRTSNQSKIRIELE